MVSLVPCIAHETNSPPHSGLYLVSFGMCMYIMLVKSRSKNRQRIIFLIVALLLFTFATLDVALLLRHVLDAFIWYHGPGGPNGEFSDISYWVNAMKSANYVIQTSIGDAVLVCYASKSQAGF